MAPTAPSSAQIEFSGRTSTDKSDNGAETLTFPTTLGRSNCGNIVNVSKPVWLMDQGFEASVPSGYLLALRLIQPAEFHMTTGVVVSMNDEATWEAANRRHPLKSTDDLLVISDRDRLAEAVYAAAVETGALVGAV